MGRPRLLRPAPSPARLTATRRLPDRPIFPPSLADGRTPLKGSFSPPAPQKGCQGSGETTTERRLHAPGLPDATPRLCALRDCLILQTGLGVRTAIEELFPQQKATPIHMTRARGPQDASRRMQQGIPFPLNSYMRTAPERCRTAHGRGVRGYDRGGRPIAVCATFTNRGFV